MLKIALLAALIASPAAAASLKPAPAGFHSTTAAGRLLHRPHVVYAHKVASTTAAKPGLPYCGTMNGIALSEDVACFMDTRYPTPRLTDHGWACPSQYHVSGRPGALRCDEET
jgi:hypothetical protein